MKEKLTGKDFMIIAIALLIGMTIGKWLTAPYHASKNEVKENPPKIYSK